MRFRRENCDFGDDAIFVIVVESLRVMLLRMCSGRSFSVEEEGDLRKAEAR